VRCLASVALAVGLCLSVCVCLLQVGVILRQLNGSSCFWHGGFLPPIFCYKRNSGTSKNKGTSLTNFVPNLDLGNFDTASRWRCEQNTSTVEMVDETYDRKRIVAVYCTSVNCNPITQLLPFVVQLVSSVMQQLTRFRLT